MNYDYSAKEVYKHGNSREEYEKLRFSGLIGRYRHVREQATVSTIIERLPQDISILDCPCGSGRWWPVLARRAKKIIAMDISPGMIEHAKNEAQSLGLQIELFQGNAEKLDLFDSSVDYTFSFALTKHLPVPVQYKVLAEFARVSRKGVICTFGVFSHLTYEVWRRRHLAESYPVFFEELGWMAKEAGLKIEFMHKCTTLIGVEHVVLLKK